LGGIESTADTVPKLLEPHGHRLPPDEHNTGVADNVLDACKDILDFVDAQRRVKTSGACSDSSTQHCAIRRDDELSPD